jgi:hypothetical protein
MRFVVGATDWTQGVSAVAASVTALFVLVGGGWALYNFRQERPYEARANLTLKAELLVSAHGDLVRAECSASAVGKGELFLRKDGGFAAPSVRVQAMTSALIAAPPDDWSTLPACSAPIFVDDVSVEGGEILNGVALVLVGPRVAGTLAYRILATLTASEKADSPDDQTFTWNALAIVPVEATLPAPAAP